MPVTIAMSHLPQNPARHSQIPVDLESAVVVRDPQTYLARSQTLTQSTSNLFFEVSLEP